MAAPVHWRTVRPGRGSGCCSTVRGDDRKAGSGVELVGEWPIRDGAIDQPFSVGRWVTKTRAELLADLVGDRVYARRIAFARLAGWTGEPEIVDALRVALDHPDRFTTLVAASSLGHRGDAAPSTWDRVLALADEAAPGSHELGQAIVQLARLDPRRRAEAVGELNAMVERYPVATRDQVECLTRRSQRRLDEIAASQVSAVPPSGHALAAPNARQCIGAVVAVPLSRGAPLDDQPAALALKRRELQPRA